jgi:hypothetical protein
VAGNGAHGVVGDARGCRAADPCWVREEWIKAAIASLEAVVSKVSDLACVRGLHRPSLCKFRQSGAARSIVSRRRVESGIHSHQRSRETMDICPVLALWS